MPRGALLTMRAQHERDRHPRPDSLRRRAHAPTQDGCAGRDGAFSRSDSHLRARRGGASAPVACGRGVHHPRPWRRRPRLGRGCEPHRDRRRRRQGGGDRRGGKEHNACQRCQASLDRPRGGRPGRRHRLVGGQGGLRPHGQGRGAHAGGAVDGRRSRLRAEGAAPCRRPLQRRHALVRERTERAGHTAMEGLPSRRAHEPRRSLRRHLHAGAGAARLAARRPQGHAHVGL